MTAVTTDHPGGRDLQVARSPGRRHALSRGRRTFLYRRIGFYLAAAWAAISLNFLVPRLMPGDPASSIADQMERVSGQAVPPQTLQAIEGLFGNPRENLLSQYVDYLTQLAHGNLGISIQDFPVPVVQLVASRLPWTLLLVGSATVLAFAIGTSLGVAAGSRAGSRLDSFLTPVVTFVSSVPYFWVALLGLWAFAFQLRWFPLGGGYDPDLAPGSIGFAISALRYGLLPAATIVFSAFGGWMLGMRNMTVTTLGEDYVQLAHAKGLSAMRVRWRYAARNAMLPQFTGFAMALGQVVGGALLTEVVFSYPGIGSLLYEAMTSRDYPVMQGVFLLITITVLLANLVADSVYVLLDPRIRERR